MKSYTHFTLNERICLANLLSNNLSIRTIAKKLKRSPSSISREIKRNHNNSHNGYTPFYSPIGATARYLRRRKASVRKFIIGQSETRDKFIIQCLNEYWSPEIISNYCKKMNLPISTSTIYRAIKRKLLPNISEKEHLRRRGIMKYKHGNNCNSVKPTRTIHEREEIVNIRGRLGDYEGDTIYGGVGKGYLVTLVDRQSRYLIATKCEKKSTKEINKAIIRILTEQGKMHPKTITLDNGSEFAEFKEIEKVLGVKVYFADVHSPWQRGSNENINGLLRYFFPKGTNFNKIPEEEIQKVVSLINNRPRKCLDYMSPLDFITKKCCT